MSNFDTIQAITANLETVLKKLGINFVKKAYDDESAIPASLIPLGQIFYDTESFEFNFGEKPKYIEADFSLRVVLNQRDPVDMIREQQNWVHLIRDGLTVNALNIGDLASSKLISKVLTESVSINNKNAVSALNYQVKIRYREL